MKDSSCSARRERTSAAVRRVHGCLTPPRVCLLGLLTVGLGVRIWAMVAYSPAVLTNHAHDGANYILAARAALSRGDQEPLGYPLFLRALHAFSHQLAFTIGAQHALGLLTGLLLYLSARRLGAGRWLSLVPAAAAWLGGDQLFLEHAPLSDSLFIALLAATLYAGLKSIEGGALWLMALGALSVALLAVRSVALPLPLLVIGWIALVRLGAVRAVARAVALVCAAAIPAAFCYAAVEHGATGNWTVMAAGSGWSIYARAAEFADCRDFTPPPGTAVLCDKTPPAKRPGVGYYEWLGGPAVSAFGGDPAHDGQLRAFSYAAIVHQPLDFLSLAGSDLVRYVYPEFDHPRYGGFGGPETLSFPTGTPQLDPQTASEVAAYYGPVAAPKRGAADGLHAYQDLVRLSGPVMFLLLLVALTGFAAAGRPRRRELVLPLMVAAELLIVPTFTGATWRYAVPAGYPIALAAVAGWAILWPKLGGIAGLALSGPPAGHGEGRAAAVPAARESAR